MNKRVLQEELTKVLLQQVNHVSRAYELAEWEIKRLERC